MMLGNLLQIGLGFKRKIQDKDFKTKDSRQESSGSAPVIDVELKPRIGREQRRDLRQALGHRRWRQQRIFALTQLVVINIQAQRKQINGNGVRKRGCRKIGARFLVGASRALAEYR